MVLEVLSHTLLQCLTLLGELPSSTQHRALSTVGCTTSRYLQSTMLAKETDPRLQLSWQPQCPKRLVSQPLFLRRAIRSRSVGMSPRTTVVTLMTTKFSCVSALTQRAPSSQSQPLPSVRPPSSSLGSLKATSTSSKYKLTTQLATVRTHLLMLWSLPTQPASLTLQ